MRRTLAITSAALLMWGVWVFFSGPVQAEPRSGAENCPEPQDMYNCRTTLLCINGTLYCCYIAPDGHKECEPEPTALSGLRGGVTQPGPLRIAPVNPSPGMGGMRTPGTTGTILRRGVEGEQPAEPAPDTSTPTEQSGGKKSE